MTKEKRMALWRSEIVEQLPDNPLAALDRAEQYFSIIEDDDGIMAICIKEALKNQQLERAKRWVAILLRVKKNQFTQLDLLLILITYRDSLIRNDVVAFIATYNAQFKDPELLSIAAKTCLIYEDHNNCYQLAKRAVVANRVVSTLEVLATAQQYNGDFHAARATYQEIISMGVSAPYAHYMLSNSSKWSKENNNLTRLLSEVTKYTPQHKDYPTLCYAIGKEYEDVENYNESFKWLSVGARIKRAQLNYSSSTDEKNIQLLNLCFKYIKPGSLASHKTPVFIMGLPRTGSTLLERSLSSHSKISSIGESQALRIAMRHTLSVPGLGPELWGEIIKGNKTLDCNKLVKLYDQYTETEGSEGYIINKTPQNIYLLGVILKAFPKAKIIITTRNPMDTCFSNFKQLFGPVSFPYSYNLKEITEQYIMIKRHTEYWQKKYPDRVYFSSYEKLTSKPEEHISEVLEFLGEEMEYGCASPEENDSSIATASFLQARQPINTRSVHKWERYKDHLKPVEDVFRSAGISIE